MRRLFLLAGYDRDDIIGPSLIFQCARLNELGDVVVCIDSNCSMEELIKLKPFSMHAEAERHREYDFGSYKRAWEWANGNLDITSYEFVYLVNDSVYGPLFDLEPGIREMEEGGTDAFALVMNPHKKRPHLQSWFLGMGKKVFLSDSFNRFLGSITALGSKEEVCIRYENGFTKMLSESGYTFRGLFSVRGKRIYNRPLELCRRGIPFIKKTSLTRHGGCLGRQVRKVMDRTDPSLRTAVVQDIDRLNGDGYYRWLTDGSSFTMFRRYYGYLQKKL